MKSESSILTPEQEIIRIALPAMLEALVTSITSIIDSGMVSKLGTEAISAIAITNQPKLFLFAFFFAVNTVLSTKVSFYLGREERDIANRHFLTALTAVTAGSLVLGLLTSAAAMPILRVCSGQEDTMAMSALYFRIIMGGMVFNHLLGCVNAGLRGCGYTRVTFLSNAVSCGTNICLNYLLIEGHFGFPRLGIAGAAIATVLGTAVALLFSIVYLLRANAFISLKYCRERAIRPGKDVLLEQLGMGKHVVTENLMTRVGFLVASSIAARIGSFAMSVYAVGMHLLDVAYAIGSGFQASSVALIGRSRGAGYYDKIKEYARTILRCSLVFSFGLAAAILLLGRPYFSFFSKESDFVRTGAQTCLLIAVITPVQITKIIYTGFLQGLGEMKVTMRAAVIAVTGVQVVGNCIFTFLLSLGIWGIWLSGLITQATWFVLVYRAYKKCLKKGKI